MESCVRRRRRTRVGIFILKPTSRRRRRRRRRRRTGMAHIKILEGDSGPLAIASSLKVCALHKDLSRGSKLHADIARRGLIQKDVFVTNAVINVYAKCGALDKAHEVLNGLPHRDVVSWNVLISGYAQQGRGEYALKCFERMRLENIHPNTATFLAILKAFVSMGLACKSKEIHAQIAQDVLLERNIVVGNAVIDMYCKIGSLTKAQIIFDKLSVRNVVTWNSLVAGYAHDGHGERALDCFEHMQLEGVSPDLVTFLSVLKACTIIEASDTGQEIHAEIARKGQLATKVEVFNALVDMYGKCGMLSMAQEVFDTLQIQNVATWNSLIAGYVYQGCGNKALKFFEMMQLAGFSPNCITLVCAMKACISIGTEDEGLKVHALVVKGGLLERDNVVGTAIIDMYAKCGAVQKAQEVFDSLPIQVRASWNALIAGYVQYNHNGKALSCFEAMQMGGISPDAVTFLHILKACGNLGAANKGRELHAEIAKEGLQETDLVVANALVDMYFKCGLPGKAKEVFDKLPLQNVTSWNALIFGYTEHLHSEEALHFFECMQLEGIPPDVITFVSTLKACGNIRALDKGQEIHSWIVREYILKDDMVVSTALVDMYVNCGMLREAQAVFDRSVRDEVSWNVLVTGFAQHSQGEKALKCFEQMQHEGFFPNAITFVSTLKACASIGAACKGQEIHAEVVRMGSLEKDAVLGTALVDMYASCGMFANSQEMFDAMLVWDLVSWATLITVYAQLGKDDFVLDLFRKMTEDGKEPDLVTFTIVLNACSHTGIVYEGQLYFQTMNTCYGISPTLEHYTCMIDLFGRAGILDKAIAIIDQMPFFATLSVWHNLLGACQKHGNVEFGRVAFEHATQLDEEDDLAFVSMRNICVAASRQEDADKTEKF